MPDTGNDGGVFRDPPPVAAQSAALEARLASLLVSAPGLPAPLPVPGLQLLGVRAGPSVLSLVVGSNSPLAALDVAWPADAATARVSVRFESDEAPRNLAPVLERLAERLARTLTRARWEPAWELAKTLRTLPREVPLTFFRQRVAGIEPMVGLVRTGFGCNQDCGLCWQDRLWGRFDAPVLMRWIEDLYLQGARQLVLSGGEPTLDPRLCDYLRHARALGYTQLTLETNAILCARGSLATELREAGLSVAFVSLHSHVAAVSDAITRAPGTFERTCEGIEALLRAGVPVRLNAVLTAEGLASLEGLADFVADRFGPAGGVSGLMLSYPTLPYRRELIAALMPPPEPLRRALRTTVARARARGLALNDLHGPCGPALCALGDELAGMPLHAVEPVPFRTHPEPCNACAARPFCLGVRHEELQLFGAQCATPYASLPG